MKEFLDLLEIVEKLNGPEGCPWDRVQTFDSLKGYVLEEAHEVIEAVEEKNYEELIAELGDLFYTVIFYSAVAEREGLFSLKNILSTLCDKLVRRHPHVFGNETIRDLKEFEKQWEERKKQEKSHGSRKSALDGIPKNIPTLIRVQKVIKKILSSNPQFLTQIFKGEELNTNSKEKFMQEFFNFVEKANQEGIDLESSLMGAISRCEKKFREEEVRDQ